MFGPGRDLFKKGGNPDTSDSEDSDSEPETLKKQVTRTQRYPTPRTTKQAGKKPRATVESLISQLGLPKSMQRFGTQPNTSRKQIKKKSQIQTYSSRISQQTAKPKEIIARPKGPLLSYQDLQETIPVQENVSLETHIKCINCIEFDKSNSRMVAGSDDHILSFWDLDNMNSSLSPFRTLRPIDGQPIVALSFNSKQDKLLVCGGGCQPKLLTRDGREIVEFVKGDMYIKDLKFTKGHTSNITHGLCNPFHENICYTSGVDGTIRVWDMDVKLFGVEQQLPNSAVFRTLDSQKRRLSAQHFCFINSKRALAVFCERGHLQIFDQNNRYSRPELTHVFGFQSEVTASICLQDPYRLASRSVEDGAVRIFDIRRLDRLEKVWHGIYNNHSGTGLEVSPDGNLLVTGRSFDREAEGGLVFLDIYNRLRTEEKRVSIESQRKDRDPKERVSDTQPKKLKHEGLAGKVQQVYQDNEQFQDKQENFRDTDTSAVDWMFGKGGSGRDSFAKIDSGMVHTTAIKWPRKLNQIFAGCGSSITVFFDRNKSKKGIIRALNKIKTKPKIGT